MFDDDAEVSGGGLDDIGIEDAYYDEEDIEEFENIILRSIVYDYQTFGILPRCAKCKHDCKMPNRPDSSMKIICPKSRGYRQECERRHLG